MSGFVWVFLVTFPKNNSVLLQFINLFLFSICKILSSYLVLVENNKIWNASYENNDFQLTYKQALC